jgi:hypothetical protein
MRACVDPATVRPARCARGPSAVAATLRQRGIQGCAAYLAGELGDHPDTAAARVRWTLATVRTAYPTHPLDDARPGHALRPLALAG